MSRPRRWLVWLLAFALSAAGGGVGGAEPPRRGATSAPHIDALLVRLSDADPAAREESRNQLLNLRPEDLPALRDAVERVAPLHPSQAAMLLPVVEHLFLTAQPLEADATKGFLGIGMPHETTRAKVNGGAPRVGVMVTDRFPGFDAFRALRNDDVIVDVDVDGGPVGELTQPGFRQFIQGLPGGAEVTLGVVRDARQLVVVVRVSPRPRLADLPDPQLFREALQQRRDAATDYWHEHFAPLVARDVS